MLIMLSCRDEEIETSWECGNNGCIEVVSGGSFSTQSACQTYCNGGGSGGSSSTSSSSGSTSSSGGSSSGSSSSGGSSSGGSSSSSSSGGSSSGSSSSSSSGGGGTGTVTFYVTSGHWCVSSISVEVDDEHEYITTFYSDGNVGCGASGCATFTLPSGSYYFYADCDLGNGYEETWSGSVTVSQDDCTLKLID